MAKKKKGPYDACKRADLTGAFAMLYGVGGERS